MDLSAYIYGNTNLCNITQQGLLVHREWGVRTECSLGDSVYALKTVQSLFLFQYKVSSSREKSYCELKIREEVLLRNFLLSKPIQLCQNLTYKIKSIAIMKNKRESWDYKYEGFMQKWIPLFFTFIYSRLQSLEWNDIKPLGGFFVITFSFWSKESLFTTNVKFCSVWFLQCCWGIRTSLDY